MEHATPPPKKPKSEVNYSRGMGTTRCRNCTYFYPNARQCAKVAGPIEPSYWCELFTARR